MNPASTKRLLDKSPQAVAALTSLNVSIRAGLRGIIVQVVGPSASDPLAQRVQEHIFGTIPEALNALPYSCALFISGQEGKL